MSTARTVGRNTVFTALGRFAVLIVWFVMTPRILGALGVDRFGLWSLLLAMGGSLATLDLGLGIALTRYVAELNASGRLAEVPRLTLRASGLQLLFGVVLVVPCLLLRDPLLHSVHVPAAWLGEAREAYVWTLAAFAAGMLANLVVGVMQGFQRMGLAAWVQVPAAAGLLVAITRALRSPHPLIALVRAQLVFSVVVAVALFALLVVVGRKAPPSKEEALPLRRVVRFGGWLQLTSLLALVQTQLDKLILAWFVALAPVGMYELGWRGAYAISLAPMFFLAALLPAATHLGVGASGAAHQNLYRRIVGPYLLFVTVLTAAGIALAPPLLETWLRAPSPDAVFMLRLVLVAQLANLWTGAASTMARVIERAHFESQYLGLAVGLHVGLAALGLALLGWRGVLYGFALSACLGAAWFIARVDRALGLKPLAETARALAPALACSLPAVAAALAVARGMPAATPGRAHGVLVLGLGGAAFALVFAAVLGLGFRAYAASLWQRTRALVGA